PNGQYSGDTYKMMDGSVDLTIQADGRSVSRISDVYDANNPFSLGSSAIAYPYHRYTTVSKTSGNWYRMGSDNSSLAIMDTLKLGNSIDNTGSIYGFIAVGGAYEFSAPDKNTPTPTPTGGPSNTPTPTPPTTPTPTPSGSPPPPTGGGCPADP